MSKENVISFFEPSVVNAYMYLVLNTDFKQAFVTSVSQEDFELKKEKLLQEVDSRLLSGTVEDLNKLITSMQITRTSRSDEIQELRVLERLENKLGLTVEKAVIVLRLCTQLNEQILYKFWAVSSQDQG